MHSHVPVLLSALLLFPACATSSAPADATPPPSPAATTPAATTPPDQAALAADPNACPLGKSDTWNACVGKLVEIRGQSPKFVNQHPVLAPLSPPGGDQPTIHQSYLETSAGNQIIVLSRQDVKCSGAMRVKGNLRAIDLGGPDRTKESYRGWAIDDATIVCE